MKTREFTIYKEAVDIDVDSEHMQLIVEDYIYDDLEIPQECIRSLQIFDEYVNIKLQNTGHYFNDDWYVNLQRVG